MEATVFDPVQVSQGYNSDLMAMAQCAKKFYAQTLTGCTRLNR